MTFLIIKIFFYLVTAAGIGFAAGWLYRNLQNQKSEEGAQRAMHQAKSKVPQLESLLRGRDDQIRKLKEELQERKQSLQARDQTIAEKEKELLDHKREINRYKQGSDATGGLSLDDVEDDTNDLIAELSREITLLKTELKEAQSRADTPPATSSEHDVLTTEISVVREQVERLTEKLRQAEADLEREQEVVLELERERELQNKSLKVLHQQLELERSRQVVNG